MIAIVSSNARERNAFANLCEQRGWPCMESESVRAFRRGLPKIRASVVLARHRLTDGYSDDLLALVASQRHKPHTRFIILVAADTPIAEEARQIALGADCVQRDPVRSDVLLEYLLKYLRESKPGRRLTPATSGFVLAGATIDPLARTLRHRKKCVRLTPREVELAERLHEFKGQLASYSTLYSEILGRQFRGDTSNLRVLLGKLVKSFKSAGLNLRPSVEVIAKSGYRYSD
jgi:DNA-binding response OmpR family regulator